MGSTANVTSSWLGSSQSGDLTPTSCFTCRVDGSLPSPPSFDPSMDADAIEDALGSDPEPSGGLPFFNPIGDVEGRGHFAANSGNTSNLFGGAMVGGWSLSGIMRAGIWKSLTGALSGGMNGSDSGSGSEKDLFVAFDHGIDEIPFGSRSWDVSVTFGSGVMGGGASSLAMNVESVLALAQDGGVSWDATGDVTAITDDGNGNGYSFALVNLGSSQQTSSTLGDIDTSHLPAGTMIEQHSASGSSNSRVIYSYLQSGDGENELSVDAETLIGQANAGASGEAISNWRGDGFSLFLIKVNGSSSASSIYSGPGWRQQDTGSQTDTFFEMHFSKFDEDGDLTASATADSESFGGSAQQSFESTLKYRSTTVFSEYSADIYSQPIEVFHHALEDRTAIFNRTASGGSYFDAATGQMVSLPITYSGMSEVALSSPTDQYFIDRNEYGGQPAKTAHELALEQMFEPVYEPEEEGIGQVPDDYVYPTNPASTGWLSIIAGRAGDGFDQTLNFTAGFVDSATPTGLLTRKAVGLISGYDGADEDTWAYTGGEILGTGVSLVVPGGAVNRLSSTFDDAGRCANRLTKIRFGGCFVPGTLVTLSGMPRSDDLQSQLWEEFHSDTDARDIDFASPVGNEQLGNELLRRELSPFSPLRGEGAGMRGSSSRLQSPASSLLQIPIEDVPLGARIATKNPRPWEYDDSLPEPDEATWAKLSITVERTDGGVVDAELLRPRSWIQAHGIRAGERLPLNIPELDVAGLATVTAVEPCPAISQAEGSAVTGCFITRQVDAIARIEVRGADGTTDIIEGTTIHPIWSLDRHDWVPLGELQEGEQLLGHAGPLEVLSHIILHRTTPVYNIEVHGEHVYQIGGLELLVHNSYPTPIHHLATNKNFVSTARGGPWSPKFEAIFSKAGVSLDDALNKIGIPGHRGPHPQTYHQLVYDRLLAATKSLKGDAYKAALEAELTALKTEAATLGSIINKLLTKTH